MHETGIALEIWRLSREAIRRRGPGGRVTGRLDWVRVAVGELSAVEPDLLKHAWDSLTAGTPDEGSRLEVDWRPARQYCAACEAPKPRAVGSWLRICPDCGTPLRVEGGAELDLKEIGFSGEDERPAQTVSEGATP